MKFIFFILYFLFLSFNVLAAGQVKIIPKHNWSFNGMTGKISYKQGEIFRKSTIVSVEKGKYRILEN